MITLDTPKTLYYLPYKSYQDLYIDWVNNFISTDGFASHHDISWNIAAVLIQKGRLSYNTKTPITSYKPKFTIN